jgi:hypothetical protein
MPENEDLSIFGAVPSTTQYEEVQHDADKTVKKTNHADDVGQPSQNPSDRAKRYAWKARTSFRHAQVRLPEIGSHVAIGDASVTSSEILAHARTAPDQEPAAMLDTHRLEPRSRPPHLRRESAGHRSDRV